MRATAPASFDRILRALTLAVAGILIMNVMLIAVSQRVKEIGLLKALGAPPAQIRNLFFAEAILLSGVGSVAGLARGKTLSGDGAGAVVSTGSADCNKIPDAAPMAQ